MDLSENTLNIAFEVVPRPVLVSMDSSDQAYITQTVTQGRVTEVRKLHVVVRELAF